MARIKTYEIDNVVSGNDIVIGSDFDNNDRTKNYTVDRLKEYINAGLTPIEGGTLKITTITVNNNSFATPDLYINQLDPAIEVLQYEIVFVILNGKTWIFRRNDNTFGLGETQTVLSDFTLVDVSQAVPTPNLQEVTEEGNITTEDIFVNELGLYDAIADLYSNLKSNSNELVFEDSDGQGASISVEQFIYDNGVNKFRVKSPVSFTNQTATFQNASGTIAYLSNIPSVPVQSLVAGTNVTISESPSGTFTINSTTPLTPLYVVQTQLYDNINNVSLITNGGDFSTYTSDDSFTAQYRIVFNRDVVIDNLLTTSAPFLYVNQLRNRENGISFSERLTYTMLSAVQINSTTIAVNVVKNVVLPDVYSQTFSLVPNVIVGFDGNIPYGIATLYNETLT